MSEQYEDQDQDAGEITEEQLQIPVGYYKSKKGDADKRKQTSRDNIKKAQAAKLAKSKQIKALRESEQQYEYEDVQSDSSEEELEISYVPKRTKSMPIPSAAGGKKSSKPLSKEEKRIQALESMVMKLSQAKQEAKPRKSTVIHNHVHTQPPKGGVPKGPIAFDLFH